MGKKLGFVFCLLMACLFAVNANAAENLSDWTQEKYSGNVQFIPSGTSVSLDVSSTAIEPGWGNMNKYFPGATGMLATVNCSQAKGNTEVTLWKYVGTTASGNLIQAVLTVEQNDGKRFINYMVRERDRSHTFVRMIASGYLGYFEGAWSEGEDITIGFSRLGNEIWFYTPGNGAFVKVAPFENMGSVGTEYSNCYIAVWVAAGGYSTVSATVSNVSILYY